MLYTATVKPVQPTMDPNITCAEGFYISNDTCFPSCYNWKQIDEAYTVLLFVMQLLSSLVIVVSSFILFVVSFLRRKSMYVLALDIHVY